MRPCPGLLERAGDEEPLLLILDDLQWADAPTLSLLRHIVASGSSTPVMVVGTYRDSDLSRRASADGAAADLHREQGWSASSSPALTARMCWR